MNINQNLIALIQKFNSKDLEFFLRDKSDSFEFPKEKLYFDRDKYQTYENAELLATNQLSDGTIIVCTILVTKDLTERSSKKLQFDFAKDILKNNYYDAGIFVFYDSDGHFRFSLIYAEYYGNKRSWNSFKRFTYYVSKELTNKTFLDQISNADFSSIEALKKAFSVEPVTKQFYNEIQSWYFWAMDKISFPTDYKYSDNPAKDDEIRNSNNLIRLITRIIFIWFIKQKNLINEDIFSEEKLKNIIKDFNKNKDAANYYNAILQNLFFATLNQKINEREFAENNGFNVNKKQYGVKNLYRYDDLFLITKDEVKKLFRETPFLNGGLFDCLDKEDENGKVIYIDGFSRNPNKRAIIPDYLFFQNEEKKVDLSKYGLRKDSLVRGLINILQSYNFTIDENTLIDQEVALDPELLGKVFENLLASYNPETASTARKATGSYYTPREIVDYMVQESLFSYLKSKCPDIDEAQIRNLLSYDDNTLSLTDDERNNIIKALDDIKILDPACGSGAFPMGALHMIVNALQKLDPDNNAWKNLQMAKVTEETQKIFKENDKNEREVRLNELNNTFDESINYPDYARKLFLIENCIYGVDIQTIAIQISKLRFFISLVIDQRVDKTRDNLGIRALPNMETRFVAANTLIELEKPDNLFYTDDIQDLEKELKQLRHKYFSAKTRQEKLTYQQKDKELRDKLSNALKQINYNTESSEKIAKFDIYDPNASADWFDPEWMFGVTDGFDVVIGNPPYISTKGVDKNYKKGLKSQFGFADDLYSHFFFRGIEILKNNGFLSYISSKTYWTIQTKKNLRDFLLDNKIIEIFDTGNPFESAMVDTAIIIVQKSKNNNYDFISKDGKKDFLKPNIFVADKNLFYTAPNHVFFIPNEVNKKIANKYFGTIHKLFDEWWDKISTSKNIEKNKIQLEKYRATLKPGDITLLGLITEGGQGLATGNNGKYVGVKDGTKWADNVKKQRPEKLLMAQKFCIEKHINDKNDADKFLNSLSEAEIRSLFDELKEKYGRDIFGQGWLFRIVSDDEIADVDSLTDDEKLNGIDGKRTFVPYDKGDKEGNRWWAPTPYYIDWSKENVKFLKTNSGKKGEGMPVVRNPQFYFREGFCWNNVSTPKHEESMYIKCRFKEKSINDVASMSLFAMDSKKDLFVNNYYLISLINSRFLFNFLKIFINESVNLQINDIRQLPIIIPNSEQLNFYENIFNRAVSIQKDKFAGNITEKEAEKKLNEIQKELDKFVEEMYL